MASVSTDKSGKRRILFVDPEGKRKAIHLGEVSKKKANSIRDHIEHILTAKLTGHAIEPYTAEWLAKIKPPLADKLARVGLIPEREKKEPATLDAYCESYIGSRANLKPNTKRNYETTRKKLVDHFGADKLLSDISPGDADDWRETLLKDLSTATVSREVKRARQFFRAAVRKRLIAENPFTDLASPAQVNTSREFFVTADAAEKLLEACPNAEWRLIVALSRYGGLRCPSEHLSLKWDDIHWDRERITIRSPKTEHHAGGESRSIPLFPELKPFLDAAWDEAKPGAEFLIVHNRTKNANWRTQLLRIIDRAGLKAWPRVFHNMRASRQTELTARFPLHVVCSWLGNSAPIADKHYLQITDSHFADGSRLKTSKKSDAESDARTTQNPTQSESANNCGDSQGKGENIKKARGNRAKTLGNAYQNLALPLAAMSSLVPPRGVEPLSSD